MSALTRFFPRLGRLSARYPSLAYHTPTSLRCQHGPRYYTAQFSTTSCATFRAYTINENVESSTPPPKTVATVTEPGVEAPDYLSANELQVFEKLKRELEPTKLEVQDISGGCGSMYGLDIVSAKFKGKSIIQQHKVVNQILKEELKSWHGLQLKTRAS